MKVFVVIQDDFPEIVFALKEDAVAYCIQKNMESPRVPRRHWTWIGFNLRQLVKTENPDGYKVETWKV